MTGKIFGVFGLIILANELASAPRLGAATAKIPMADFSVTIRHSCGVNRRERASFVGVIT